MVWTPPPRNPILHLRGPAKTLCGKSIGRCYLAKSDDTATCKKCRAVTSAKETGQ